MSGLQKIFGPSKNEIWSQLSEEIGAEFYPDRFLKPGKIVLTYAYWQITLDTYTFRTAKSHTTSTHIRAPFVNPSGFRFSIYRRQFYHWLGKILGKKYIEIGDTRFDEDFIVKSTSEPMVKHLLQNQEILHLIKNQPDFFLMISDHDPYSRKIFPKDVDELFFSAAGVIKNKEQLKELLNLFILVLNELCRMGAASEKSPGVVL